MRKSPRILGFGDVSICCAERPDPQIGQIGRVREVRQAARAVVLDPDDRVLLVHWVNADHDIDVWLTPGGGVDPGEDSAAALRRELREETGLDSAVAGPVIWTRRHAFPWYGRTVEQQETFVLLRTPAFEPRPDPAALATEGVREVRWWTIDEIEASNETFAPRRLAALLRDLLRDGAPAQPLDAGI
jgi:8-oxo-dGTP pyrophosphatase MutT (NUDIX family)